MERGQRSLASCMQTIFSKLAFDLRRCMICGKVHKNAFIFEDCKHCICNTCEPKLTPDSYSGSCSICRREGPIKKYDDLLTEIATVFEDMKNDPTKDYDNYKNRLIGPEIDYFDQLSNIIKEFPEVPGEILKKSDADKDAFVLAAYQELSDMNFSSFQQFRECCNVWQKRYQLYTAYSEQYEEFSNDFVASNNRNIFDVYRDELALSIIGVPRLQQLKDYLDKPCGIHEEFRLVDRRVAIFAIHSLATFPRYRLDRNA